MSPWESAIVALNESGARYVVVGGLAVVLHGYARLTADLDLIVDLDPPEARKAMDALTKTGLRPRAPVSAEQFADPATRRGWIKDKGMRVFSLWDPTDALREVDVFVEEPLPFEGLFNRARIMDLGAMTVRVASIADLIELKRLAGRPQDLQDVEALEAIQRERDASKT